MNLKPFDLNYVILSGRFCKAEQLPIYQSAFEFWFKNWSMVYAELAANKGPNPDDFFRQDFIPVILHEGKIVAIHLYSLYDVRMRCGFEHSYLKYNFNEVFFSDCQRWGIGKMMSMESLFVDANYRKSKTGVQLSEVLISLGQKVFAELTDADAIFAPARSDNKVAQTCNRLGFDSVQKNIILNNVPVDFIFCRRPQIRNAEDEVRFFVESLWERKGNEVGHRPSQKMA
jgi:hypothetical protein